ncbi:winged helix-turn-helix domain-containing protein [Liquorilactobacillus oeni]|uniref:Uncharacterized protein n=1 Tax=Liquorilactobacillus oeni DSM 19972 TaxID=1423777 RepID=A0A0R1MJ01_9LACO|nr:helix-turn-helix domain-containing protein [Liquorilactobacillus oeni]KRL04427.1 hypothetical protein FD46_GL001556 [Liquorilactobacillus oeni DSM 19972]
MQNKKIANLAKLMADEKVNRILTAASNNRGMTTKEIAKAVKLPVSQLYYTINKMTDAGLLEIVRQEKVKNLDEYYYSSEKLVGKASVRRLREFGFPDDELTEELERGEELNISPEWTAGHLNEITQLVLYRNNQFLAALQKNIKKYDEKKDNKPLEFTKSSFMDNRLRLSPEADMRLWRDFLVLATKAEKEDQGKNKHEVNLMMTRWVEENNGN